MSTDEQQKKLNELVSRLGQLLDGKGQKEAHVIFRADGRLQQAEVTLSADADHGLVGTASEANSFLALSGALERMTKQALRLRRKQRDTRREAKDKYEDSPLGVRVPPDPVSDVVSSSETRTEEAPEEPRVHLRTDHRCDKPLTLEEAMMEIEVRDRDYFAYCEFGTDKLSVLIRRRDGDFDLVQ